MSFLSHTSTARHDSNSIAQTSTIAGASCCIIAVIRVFSVMRLPSSVVTSASRLRRADRVPVLVAAVQAVGSSGAGSRLPLQSVPVRRHSPRGLLPGRPAGGDERGRRRRGRGALLPPRGALPAGRLAARALAEAVHAAGGGGRAADPGPAGGARGLHRQARVHPPLGGAPPRRPPAPVSGETRWQGACGRGARCRKKTGCKATLAGWMSQTRPFVGRLKHVCYKK